MKPVPRVLSNSSAHHAVLKDVPRSPRRSASDQVIREKDSPSNVDLANGTARSQDTSRTLRRPLSDSTNICRGSQDIVGRHSDHQLLQPQRRLLHAALARRRSSCVRLSPFLCRAGCGIGTVDHRSRIRYLSKKNSGILTNFPKLKKFVKKIH